MSEWSWSFTGGTHRLWQWDHYHRHHPVLSAGGFAGRPVEFDYGTGGVLLGKPQHWYRRAIWHGWSFDKGRRWRYGGHMNYRVVLIETEEGFAVSCPALPGCHSQGTTHDEALANIREAIQLWLEVAEEDLRREPEAEGARVTRELVTV